MDLVFVKVRHGAPTQVLISVFLVICQDAQHKRISAFGVTHLGNGCREMTRHQEDLKPGFLILNR